MIALLTSLFQWNYLLTHRDFAVVHLEMTQILKYKAILASKINGRFSKLLSIHTLHLYSGKDKAIIVSDVLS